MSLINDYKNKKIDDLRDAKSRIKQYDKAKKFQKKGDIVNSFLDKRLEQKQFRKNLKAKSANVYKNELMKIAEERAVTKAKLKARPLSDKIKDNATKLKKSSNDSKSYRERNFKKNESIYGGGMRSPFSIDNKK